MHFLIYEKDILHAYGLPTAVTIAVLVGGLYGALRLVIDLVRFFVREDREHRAWKRARKEQVASERLAELGRLTDREDPPG